MNQTFYPKDVAEKLSSDLNADEGDDWSYKAVDCENGRAYVEVYDEEGEFVGYL